MIERLLWSEIFFEPEDADTAVYDAEGCYVTPGFIDVHTHGGFGVDVNAATQEDYEKIGHFFAKEAPHPGIALSWRILKSRQTGALKKLWS